MSLLTFLMIAAAIALMVGPVMMLQPSARQRQLIALRAQALNMGLKVRMSRHKGNSIAEYYSSWTLADNEKFCGEIWSLQRQNIEHEIHFHRDWNWEGPPAKNQSLLNTLHQLLDECPRSIVGLSATPMGVSCLWQERGGEVELQKVGEMLSQLSSACASFAAIPADGCG